MMFVVWLGVPERVPAGRSDLEGRCWPMSKSEPLAIQSVDQGGVMVDQGDVPFVLLKFVFDCCSPLDSLTIYTF